MTIGIDCRSILNPGFGEGTGVGHYTYCLVEALVKNDLANRYVLFFDTNVSLDAVREFIGPSPHVKVRQFPFHEYRKHLPTFYTKAFLPALYARERLDVLLEPSENVAAGGFIGKKVIVVHNVCGAVQAEVIEAIQGASRVIVFSQFAKTQVAKGAGVDEKRIDVIPEGVTPQFHFTLADGTVEVDANTESRAFDARMKFGLTERFVLFLGTIDHRKNVSGLMRAFTRHAKEHPYECADLTLALAGGKGEGSEAVFAELDELNDQLQQVLGRRPIRYLGYVNNEEKWDLLERASCFAYPVLCEGFGLPVLEAMSVGTPVLASNRGALPELVGVAGLLVDPEYTNEMHLALARMLRDEVSRKHFGEAGKKRAQGYNWQKAAKETLQSLHKAMMKV